MDTSSSREDQIKIYNMYFGWEAGSFFKEIWSPLCSQGTESMKWPDYGNWFEAVTLIVIQVRFPFIRYRAV